MEGVSNTVTTECGHSFHCSCLMHNVLVNGFRCPYCRAVMAQRTPATGHLSDRLASITLPVALPNTPAFEPVCPTGPARDFNTTLPNGMGPGLASEEALDARIRESLLALADLPGVPDPLYPRISPAMIVAVERGDEILLGRSQHFPAGIYSTLAGFVEPGESPENAVIREVWEETRIVVGDVRYFASQPWPFPNSLMLGFTAQYESGEIDTSHDPEVEAAGWFHVDALPKVFPGNISISQWLIHDFVARKRGERQAR